jgi:GT2 family glycosyltransferase
MEKWDCSTVISESSIDLSVIIVSYKCLDHLTRCIGSVYAKTQDARFEVIVVNDCSGDGTEQWLGSAHSSVQLISNPIRVGIGRARNQGIAAARGRFLLLLDADTELITPALDQMLCFMEAHAEVGVCGCKMLYPTGEVQSTYRKFTYPHVALFRRTVLGKWFPNASFLRDYLMTHWDHTKICEPDYVAGACMIIRSRMLEQTGCLKDYTFGPEDQEICYRARRHGWRVVYYPEAQIYHQYQRLTAHGGLNRKLLMQIGDMMDFYLEMLRDRVSDLLRHIGRANDKKSC